MSHQNKSEPVSLEQMQALLKLLGDKSVNRERMTDILSSGILADIFDRDASLKERYVVRTALGLPNYHLSEIVKIAVCDLHKLSLLGVANYPDHWEHEMLLAKRTCEQFEGSRGIYECMHVGASLGTGTSLGTLEWVAAKELAAGKWQRASEIHLTACISAFHHTGSWLPKFLIAPGSVVAREYGRDQYFYFVNSYGGMVSPHRRTLLWDIDQTLGNARVLYVRKVV